MSTIANSIAEAQGAKGEYRAGATDVSDRHRHHVSTGPIVDISRIRGFNGIAQSADGNFGIGALATIHQVATDPTIGNLYPGLAKAAGALANPQIRRAASMGGSLLQRTRCWYYRNPEFSCLKNGGDTCPMRAGNHQFGVCFDLGPCVMPHPSTLGMVLMAYDARVEVAGRGSLTMAELFGDGRDGSRDHQLREGEVLTHITLPPPVQGTEIAHYMRAIARARAEWPLVEVLVTGRDAGGGKLRDTRVVIGGVAPVPLRLRQVEAFLDSHEISEATIAEAGRLAATGANPLPGTAYKVELVTNSVIDALTAAFEHLMQR